MRLQRDPLGFGFGKALRFLIRPRAQIEALADERLGVRVGDLRRKLGIGAAKRDFYQTSALDRLHFEHALIGVDDFGIDTQRFFSFDRCRLGEKRIYPAESLRRQSLRTTPETGRAAAVEDWIFLELLLADDLRRQAAALQELVLGLVVVEIVRLIRFGNNVFDVHHLELFALDQHGGARGVHRRRRKGDQRGDRYRAEKTRGNDPLVLADNAPVLAQVGVFLRID